MVDTQPEKFQLPIEVAAEFRVATVDSAVINQYFDGLGRTLKVIFTRLDTAVISVSMLADVKIGSVAQKGPSEFEMQIRKVQEFAALMRPDHAFQLAKALLLSLSRLDEQQKRRYNLPDIKPLIQEQTEEEGEA